MSERNFIQTPISVGEENRKPSFRKARLARKKSRAVPGRQKKQRFEDKNFLKNSPANSLREKEPVGPTPETLARLAPDPLVLFKKRNILTDQQVRSFQKIRKAIKIIVDGTQVRISRFNDVVVQTSHKQIPPETDHEIFLQDCYSVWVERMTKERLPVGPVLDIIMDELSLNAVDRKWGRRKGWARQHLQSSLDLYEVSSRVRNRDK